MPIDWGTKTGARALERLRTDMIAWLTSVNSEGQPRATPIWFLWTDEGEVLVYSQEGALRNRSLRTNPRVAFHFSDDGSGGDVVSFEGQARIDETYPQGVSHPAFLAKYGVFLDRYGWTPEFFSSRYNVPVLIRLTRLLSG